MADTAARLRDGGLPIAPYRQWTFSLPWRLRLAVAKDAKLLSRVFKLCMRKVFCWQRKRARSLSIEDGKCLGITFVQRFGSLLTLNIHGHSIVPDGVYADDGGGGLVFRPLPPATDEEVLWVTFIALPTPPTDDNPPSATASSGPSSSPGSFRPTLGLARTAAVTAAFGPGSPSASPSSAC